MSSSGDPLDSFSFGSSSPQVGLGSRGISFNPLMPGLSSGQQPLHPHTASSTSTDGLMSSLFHSVAAHHHSSLTSKRGSPGDEGIMDGVSRLKSLYPFTDVNDLPKAWSSQDRSNWISLSDNNLKAHYKGSGKGHKDAAAVRATHSIPTSCLLYYFEMKIISKGRDGYMGMGLAAIDVNMSRLPGWDKNSYGYHGDDGHSFCSSGTGVPYGPTFTTGDVIGCGFNLVENTCFYTKNGLNLGRAFSDLPQIPLYPTVGLQTPGEEVEANFGMEAFIYDIEDDIRSLRQRITDCIIHFPVPFSQLQTTMNTLVRTWLLHNGYCSTAKVFSKATEQPLPENETQIKQRLRIQQLVLSGRIEQAIRLTDKLYPDVLQENPNLRFALKCRQFIEMIDAANKVRLEEGEQSHTSSAAAKQTIPDKNSSLSSQVQKQTYFSSASSNNNSSNNRHNLILSNDQSSNSSNGVTSSPSILARQSSRQTSPRVTTRQMVRNRLNQQDHLSNNSSDCNGNSSHALNEEDEVDEDKNCHQEDVDLMLMDTDEENGKNENEDGEGDIEDGLLLESSFPGQVTMEDILSFGRDLHSQSRDLARVFGENESNQKMLADASALMAYPNPKESELGWLLNSSEREVVCQQLNNAIVMSEISGGSSSGSNCSQLRAHLRHPPLESIIKHCKTLLKLNGQSGTWLLDKL